MYKSYRKIKNARKHTEFYSFEVFSASYQKVRKEEDMREFTITERKEPFTLDEVFDFIDDTNIGEIDSCELKSRIVDVVQAERNKAIDEFTEKLMKTIRSVPSKVIGGANVLEIAEQMKEVRNEFN